MATVTDQMPGLTDEAIEEARSVLGRWFRRSWNSLEVTADAVRNSALALGDRNPLYTDPEYAADSPYGGLIAPPYMLAAIPPLHAAPKMRGIHWMYAGSDWTFYEPIRVGDTITSHARLVDLQVKEGRVGGRMVLQTGELLYVNQRGDLVASGAPTVMRTVRRRSDGKGLQYEPRRPSWTADELAELEDYQLARQRLGVKVRRAADVIVGEQLPVLKKGPFRAVDFALSGFDSQEGWYGFGQGAHVYQFLHRRRHPADAFKNPDSGLDDKAYRGHWEPYMAKQAGMPGMYDMGHHRGGLISQVVSDWAGDHAFMTRCNVVVRRPIVVGDVLSAEATVESVEPNGIVNLKLRGVIQNGDVVSDGHASIAMEATKAPQTTAEKLATKES
jgi:acyl dehydratase